MHHVERAARDPGGKTRGTPEMPIDLASWKIRASLLLFLFVFIVFIEVVIFIVFI
jgi:hypothetical protein